MKILCVAEKPSVAKSMTDVMSRGTVTRLQTFSQYNQVFSFPYQSQQHGNVDMIVTSVSGHLMSIDFDGEFTNWYVYLELTDGPQ
jgi:DNA topoisomerase-3